MYSLIYVRSAPYSIPTTFTVYTYANISDWKYVRTYICTIKSMQVWMWCTLQVPTYVHNTCVCVCGFPFMRPCAHLSKNLDMFAIYTSYLAFIPGHLLDFCVCMLPWSHLRVRREAISGAVPLRQAWESNSTLRLNILFIGIVQGGQTLRKVSECALLCVCVCVCVCVCGVNVLTHTHTYVHTYELV